MAAEYISTPWNDPSRYDIAAPCYGPSPRGITNEDLPGSCRKYRNVPGGHINSTLTQWVCRCDDKDRCKDEHKALCAQRQAARAIARLFMIQHEVALAIREALTIMIVQDRVNRPPVDGILCLAITYKQASRSEEDEAPFTLSLPEEVKSKPAALTIA